jgi:hypothetical protein
MNQGPQKPRYITPEEIAARREAQRARRKVNRKLMRQRSTEEIAKTWPYKVELHNSITQDDRFAIRRWMLDQQMRKYDPEIDNRTKSDVAWGDDWKVFRFAKEEHSILFKMCFS